MSTDLRNFLSIEAPCLAVRKSDLVEEWVDLAREILRIDDARKK